MKVMRPMLLMLLPWLTAFSLPWTVSRLSRDGRDAWQRGDWPGARSAYEQAARAAGDQPQALYNQGTSQLAAGDALAAAETLAKVRTDDPKLGAQAHYNRGNALFALGQLEAAAEAYEQALRLDPADADAQHNLSVCRRRLQRKPPDDPPDKPRNQPGDPPPPQPQPQPQSQPQPQPGLKQGDEQQPKPESNDPQATERKLSQLDADERTDRSLLRMRPRDGAAAREAEDADRQFRGLYGSSDKQDW
ncbi:MAG: tetratricopeptide repeat protein [Armatimonadetes bacterium]|nr:tetratricopeptide repeat protein [Armatimonadota bacterium]